MLARLQSVALIGIEAIPCEVEVDVSSRGFDQAVIVGLPKLLSGEIRLSGIGRIVGKCA